MKPSFNARAFFSKNRFFVFVPASGHDLCQCRPRCSRPATRAVFLAFFQNASRNVLAQTGHLDQRLSRGGVLGAKARVASAACGFCRVWSPPRRPLGHVFFITRRHACRGDLITAGMPASGNGFHCGVPRPQDVPPRGGVAWRRHLDRRLWLEVCQQGVPASPWLITANCRLLRVLLFGDDPGSGAEPAQGFDADFVGFPSSHSISSCFDRDRRHVETKC